MRATLSIPLAAIFVLLAAFNVWSMLSSHTGSKLPVRSRGLLHRAAGYAFIALFVVLSYFMLLRIKGSPDEVSPRIVLHMALAFSLLPLLVVKVIAVRRRKASHALLCALGITIYAVAFTMVTINVAVHFLRNAAVGKAPVWISLVFVFAVVLVAGLAFASRQKRGETHPNMNTPPAEQATKNPAVQRDPLTLTLARTERLSHDTIVMRFLFPFWLSTRSASRTIPHIRVVHRRQGCASIVFDLFFAYAIRVHRNHA